MYYLFNSVKSQFIGCEWLFAQDNVQNRGDLSLCQILMCCLLEGRELKIPFLLSLYGGRWLSCLIKGSWGLETTVEISCENSMKPDNSLAILILHWVEDTFHKFVLYRFFIIWIMLLSLLLKLNLWPVFLGILYCTSFKNYQANLMGDLCMCVLWCLNMCRLQ